jgi:predicted regulator of Ras-like GTPase activity (Roadblock/LC7/MglB family)
MSRADQITRVIRNLTSTTPDVSGAAVIDNDGLLIASALAQEVDEDSVAAMSAALLGLSERIATELERGNMEMTTIKGSDGMTIVSRCGPEAVMCVLADPRAKLGLIYLDSARAAKEISRLLG